MGSRSGFDADLDLDELPVVIDRGSGAVTAGQRQLNAQANLGLITLAGGFSGGAAQSMVDVEAFVILGTNFVLSNVATAQKAFNASANGAVTLQPGVYMFEAMYNITNTGTTSHTWATLFGGTATFTIDYQAYGLSGVTANTTATGGQTGFSTVATALVVSTASVSATEQLAVELVGYLNVTVAGTLIPQVQASAAPGGVQTIIAGSFFRLWKMTGVGVLGNWS